MNNLDRLSKQIRTFSLILFGLFSVLLMGGWYIGQQFFDIPPLPLLGGLIVISIVMSLGFSTILTDYAIQPVKLLWLAILHVSPEHRGTAPPNLDQIRVGRELVTSLALQVYQLASVSNLAQEKPTRQLQEETIATSLPLPVFVMDKDQNIQFANKSAQEYLNLTQENIVGKNLYSVLDLSFPTEDTFDAWLTSCRADKATASKSWDRVLAILADQKTKKAFDLAAYYNKNNPSKLETIICLFDRAVPYAREQDDISFIALAVHELRTPLTVMRGYIEVLQEELQGKASPEIDGYMQRLQASSQALSAFVSNILNVARVEENQLYLKLKEEQWEPVLKRSAADMELRARVHGKIISFEIQPNLPTVAVDRVSIYEVINNLLDNAIKYSENSNKIIVKSYLGTDGFIVTTVQDFGIGIPDSIIGNLFDKFYRNHRSRVQIGGTGLGLYLSKAIVKAHGGQIWVQSKEGQGSTFGFSLVQYANLADNLKNTDNDELTTTAHGWIKNHSFYRR